MKNFEGEEIEPSIFVNGMRVYLNEDYLTGTTGLVANESMTEQCDTCSKDIIEYGMPSKGAVDIVCQGCGTEYPIQWRLCRAC